MAGKGLLNQELHFPAPFAPMWPCDSFPPMGVGVMWALLGQCDEEADEPSLPFLPPSTVTVEATCWRQKDIGALNSVWKAALHFQWTVAEWEINLHCVKALRFKLFTSYSTQHCLNQYFSLGFSFITTVSSTTTIENAGKDPGNPKGSAKSSFNSGNIYGASHTWPRLTNR